MAYNRPMTPRKIFLPSLIIASALLLGLVGSANAQKPIPGIKSTPEYRSLLKYVNSLQTKKSTPATPAQKTAFRNNLSGRRAKANAKVKRLNTQRLARIKKQDDAAERRQIKGVRQQQARTVAQLNRAKGERIAQAATAYRLSVDRTNSNYSGRIASKSAKRKRLKSKLNRTTNPIAREVLIAQIEALGPKIKSLKAARKKQLDQAASGYQSRVDGLNQRFTAKVDGAKSFYKGLVRRIKDNWKKTFREDLKAAKSRRDSEFSLVTRLKDRGTGYIDQMPSPPPPS